jgi:cell division septal protein FtsQ
MSRFSVFNKASDKPRAETAPAFQTERGNSGTQGDTGNKPKLKPFLYSLLTLILLFASIWAGKGIQQSWIIEHIEISGAELTDGPELLEAAGLREGMPKDSLAGLKVLERVEALPNVISARLYHPQRGHVHLSITERKPIAILVQDNEMSLVDKEGVIMQLPRDQHPDLPLLYGFDVRTPGDTLQAEAFGEVSFFLQELARTSVAGPTISELGWHRDDGVFALSHEHGVKLVFGREEFGIRLRKWEAFYQKVAPQRGMDAFLSLDFRFRDQVVARERRPS